MPGDYEEYQNLLQALAIEDDALSEQARTGLRPYLGQEQGIAAVVLSVLLYFGYTPKEILEDCQQARENPDYHSPLKEEARTALTKLYSEPDALKTDMSLVNCVQESKSILGKVVRSKDPSVNPEEKNDARQLRLFLNRTLPISQQMFYHDDNINIRHFTKAMGGIDVLTEAERNYSEQFFENNFGKYAATITRKVNEAHVSIYDLIMINGKSLNMIFEDEKPVYTGMTKEQWKQARLCAAGMDPNAKIAISPILAVEKDGVPELKVLNPIPLSRAGDLRTPKNSFFENVVHFFNKSKFRDNQEKFALTQSPAFLRESAIQNTTDAGFLSLLDRIDKKNKLDKGIDYRKDRTKKKSLGETEEELKRQLDENKMGNLYIETEYHALDSAPQPRSEGGQYLHDRLTAALTFVRDAQSEEYKANKKLRSDGAFCEKMEESLAVILAAEVAKGEGMAPVLNSGKRGVDQLIQQVMQSKTFDEVMAKSSSGMAGVDSICTTEGMAKMRSSFLREYKPVEKKAKKTGLAYSVEELKKIEQLKKDKSPDRVYSEEEIQLLEKVRSNMEESMFKKQFPNYKVPQKSGPEVPGV